MKNDLTIRKSVTLNADVAAVWDALTNPAMTSRYMFNCECVSDWKVGSRLDWRSTVDGKVYVTGKVVNFIPGQLLEYTTFEPSGDWEDIPSNHLTVTIQLIVKSGRTLLKVSHGDFANATQGRIRHRDADKGWDSALENLKDVLEK
jgi:uncharacterized protein YndB with AHSA1/START domain